eukprot:6200160-Pleurochrysis_carterae.AAC.3
MYCAHSEGAYYTCMEPRPCMQSLISAVHHPRRFRKYAQGRSQGNKILSVEQLRKRSNATDLDPCWRQTREVIRTYQAAPMQKAFTAKATMHQIAEGVDYALKTPLAAERSVHSVR